MADQPLILVGEVLLEILSEGFARMRPVARSIFHQLRRAAEPPEGVSFHSDDGAAYTGLALLDHNKVTALVASRTEPGPRLERPERPPLVTPPPPPPRPFYGPQRSFYERGESDEEERDWDRDDPYGRYK